MCVKKTRVCVLVTLLAAEVLAQRSAEDPHELLLRAIVRASSRLNSIANYSCLANVRRFRCSKPSHETLGCPICSADSTSRLISTDRLALEVAMFRDGEMFSWAGEGEFKTPDLGKLVGGGATLAGEFAAFPISILTELEPIDFEFHNGAFEFSVFESRHPLCY